MNRNKSPVWRDFFFCPENAWLFLINIFPALVAKEQKIYDNSMKQDVFARRGGFIVGWKPLPIGIDDFKKLIEQGYYYVDKTLMIKELLDQKGEVNLFTPFRKNIEYQHAPLFF